MKEDKLAQLVHALDSGLQEFRRQVEDLFDPAARAMQVEGFGEERTDFANVAAEPEEAPHISTARAESDKIMEHAQMQADKCRRLAAELHTEADQLEYAAVLWDRIVSGSHPPVEARR